VPETEQKAMVERLSPASASRVRRGRTSGQSLSVLPCVEAPLSPFVARAEAPPPCEYVRIKSALGVRCSTLLTCVRPEDTHQSTSACVNQLEGLAVARPWGFESPLTSPPPSSSAQHRRELEHADRAADRHDVHLVCHACLH
jgi:hypothetical protein